MRRRLTITLAFLLSALAARRAPADRRGGPGTRSDLRSRSDLRPRNDPSPNALPTGPRRSIPVRPPRARAAPARSPGWCRHAAPTARPPAASGVRRWGSRSFPNPVHIVKKVVGGGASTAIKSVALAAILGWVASGAESALKETAKVIDDTTSPQLTSSWFSASYWRVAGIAALLTVPFLCAAAIHALVRSDLGLLTRAAFGYLPLSLLAVGIASQLTMLLLAGTDEMSSIVASASAACRQRVPLDHERHGRSPRASPPAIRSSRFWPRSSRSPRRWRCGWSCSSAMPRST